MLVGYLLVFIVFIRDKLSELKHVCVSWVYVFLCARMCLAAVVHSNVRENGDWRNQLITITCSVTGIKLFWGHIFHSPVRNCYAIQPRFLVLLMSVSHKTNIKTMFASSRLIKIYLCQKHLLYTSYQN